MITLVPKPVRKILSEYVWLDYIPFFRNAKWAKVAELYEEAGDKASLDAGHKASLSREQSSLCNKAYLNNHIDAADYYESSAQYFADIEQHYRSAVLRMKSAQQYIASGHLDRSNMQYLVASDIFKEINKPDCYILCMSQIAKNFWNMGEYECAAKHYELCIKQNGVLGKHTSNIDYMDCLGTIWSVHMGKYNLAITVYERLVSMTDDSRFKYVLGILHLLNNNASGLKSPYFDDVFMRTYYGEYLLLLAQCPLKAVELYDVYKEFVGGCELLDILLKKLSKLKV